MYISEAKQAIKAIFKTKLTPFIVGVNGIGKTEMVRQLGEEMGFDGTIELRLGTMGDAGDLVGLPYRTVENDKEVMKYAKPRWFPSEGKYIIFLDEINRARKDLQQAVFQLIREKRIFEHVLPEGCVVVAAANPSTDAYDTVDLNDDAYADRFAFINLKGNVKEWVKYCEGVGLHEDILQFIQEQECYFTPDREDFSYNTVKFSPRSWQDIDAIYRSELPDNLLREVLFGIVGIEATQAFLKYKDAAKLNPDVIFNMTKENKKKVMDLVKENRFEQIKIASEAKFKELENSKEITEKQFNSFKEFLKLLPKDLCAGVVAQVAQASWNNGMNVFLDDPDTAIELFQMAYHDKPLPKTKVEQLKKETIEPYFKERAALKVELEKYLANQKKGTK